MEQQRSGSAKYINIKKKKKNNGWEPPGATPVPYNQKRHLLWVLVLEGLIGLHRTVQLQLLQH